MLNKMDEIDLLSEKIEREALVSLHQCCPSDARKEIGLDLVEVEDCIAACATNDPSILLNRALGLGTQRQTTAESVRKVADVYSTKGITNYFMHIYEDSLTEGARKLLSGPDFVQKRGWMKFRSDSPKPIEAKSDLRVELVGKDKSRDFGMIVSRAFGMLDISIPLMAGLANDDRWKLFVTYEGDNPAGAGSFLYLKTWVGLSGVPRYRSFAGEEARLLSCLQGSGFQRSLDVNIYLLKLEKL